MKFCVSNKLSEFARSVAAAVMIVALTLSLTNSSQLVRAHGYGSWIEVGKCETDFTAGWPGWLRSKVNEWADEHPQWDLAHEDAYITRYADATLDEQVSHTERGFFAILNSLSDYGNMANSLWESFFNRRTIYVNGEMLNDQGGGNCTEVALYAKVWLEHGGGNPVYRSHDRINESWAPNYHLFARNCEHFADYVVTGIDLSE